jgi:mevalonate kinase
MADLLSSQAKVKYLNVAKDGKYRMVSRSNEARETEWQRQQEKLHSIQAIVERLEEDYPASGNQLRPLSLAIKSRLAQAASIKPHKLVEVT